MWQNGRPVSSPPAIETQDLGHRFGDRPALEGVSFSVGRGELFALLGPNGGGKTTLFRILSTLLVPTRGEARVFGLSVRSAPHQVRGRLGVVFQNPALDPQLTSLENLLYHGHLYGLGGAELRRRALDMLRRLEVEDRAGDRVQTLSGGLRRRVELAKGLLHRPDLLLLDEPSTGLDPGARREFGSLLRHLRDTEGVTVALTTHFIEEAERCDRVGFLSAGRLVAIGPPAELRSRIAGDVVVLEADDPAALAGEVGARFGVQPRQVDGTLHIELARGHEFIREVVEAFPEQVRSASFARPTLEDVFLHVTGRRLAEETRPPDGREASK